MTDTPRFGIRFKYRPTDSHAIPRWRLASEKASGADHEEPGTMPGSVERHDRVPIYRQAIELAASAHEVIELAEAERFFLRDQLDRKSSIVPQLLAQGLATADMVARRALFRQARAALTDCATLFDMMIERQSVRRELLEAARTLALGLLDQLLPLTVEPPRVW
jgi:hypothetical protein